jgi:RES domain-containing protein
LERLVWTDDDVVQAGIAFALVPLPLDEEQHLDRLGEEDLLPAWDASDHAAACTRATGTQWLAEGKTPVRSVPSVLLPRARNFLVNPLAPAFDQLTVGEAVPLE